MASVKTARKKVAAYLKQELGPSGAARAARWLRPSIGFKTGKVRGEPKKLGTTRFAGH